MQLIGLLNALVVVLLAKETFCANEDDNPVAFLRFEVNIFKLWKQNEIVKLIFT